MRQLWIAAGLLLAPVLAPAQDAGYAGAATHAIVAQPAAIAWQPAPASLPPGAQAAVLEGDPAKPGPFTLRLRFPDGYRIAPHFHPAQERVTVISGTFALGMGDAFDTSRLSELKAGSYASMPPGMRHFARAVGETVVQVNGVGPWALTYVNPADDPRGQKR